MSCINTNLPEFIKLHESTGNSEETRMSKYLLAAKVGVWMDDNSNNTESQNINDLKLIEPDYTESSNEDVQYVIPDKYPTLKDLGIFPVYNTEEKETKLKELLSNIGVTVEYSNLPEGISGMADTFNGIVSLAFNKANVDTLSEEAGHMFVEFIQQTNPKLYNVMAADVTRFPLYQDVKNEYMQVYNGDISKIKKEAIGKVIGKYITAKQEGKELNLPVFVSWFDKAINWFRGLLGKAGIESQLDYNNYFGITADQILAGDFQGKLEPSNTGVLYSLDKQTPLEKLDDFSSRMGIEEVIGREGDIENKYTLDGKAVADRVTNKIKKKKANFEKDDVAKIIDGRRALWGTNGHEDLMTLWQIKLGELNPAGVKFKNNDIIIKELEEFVNTIYNQFPKANFRTEVKIYDPGNPKKKNDDTGGTIDLVIEDQYGVVHIMDYKFIEDLDRSGVKEYRRQDWNTQLGEYQRILKEVYGFDRFGQLRIIPINAKYTGQLEEKTLSDVEIGYNTINRPDRAYLNPVPAFAERTGITKADELIGYLYNQYNKLKLAKGNTEGERSNIQYKKDTILDAIAKLQINQEFINVVDLARLDQARMQFLMAKDSLTPDDISELNGLIKHYDGFISKGFSVDKEGEQIEELTYVASYAQMITVAAEAKIADALNNYNIDVNQPIRPPSWINRLQRLSDYDIPAFQAFSRLVNRGFNSVEAKIRKEHEEIQVILAKIYKEQGVEGIKAFEPILQKDEEGKLIPKLVPQRSKEWYNMHTATYNDTKLKANLNKHFDTTAYNEAWKAKRKEIQSYMQNASDEQINKRIQDEERSYERFVGIGNPNSKYFTIPDNFLDPAYLEHIKNKPDSGLAQLYTKYMTINRFASENVDTNVKGNILPYITKSGVEGFLDNGINVKSSFGNLFSKLKTHEWETYELDNNGQRVYKIPIKYDSGLGNRKSEEQSYDLGKMLLMWTESVYTAEYLHKTESTAKLFGMSLNKSKEITLDKGKAAKDEGGNLILASQVSSETIDQYQEYLNMYYYGVKNEDADMDIMGYSGHKIVKAGISWLSTKSLAGNIFSAFSNMTGGIANAAAIGSQGNHFKFRDFGKLVTNLHDPKMRAAVALFDIDTNIYDQNKAKDLSSTKIGKHVTWDKLFILQKKGDWLIQNSTLVAMMKNYSIVEGRFKKTVEEGSKSVFDSMSMVNDKVVIEGLDLTTEEGMITLLDFREKVRAVNGEILGNMSEQDMALAGNTLVGQLLLQFKRWMLPMATSRFGAFHYNQNLDEYQVGRYRSLGKVLIQKRIIQTVKDLILQQRSPDFESILLESYKKQRDLNPNMDMTYEDFRKLYISNIKSVGVELAILAAISGLLLGLKGDDEDEERSLANRLLSRALTRTSNELSFWFLPDSFLSIVQMPIPLIGLLEDLMGLVTSSGKEITGVLMGNEEMQEAAKPGKQAIKLTIGFNAYYNFMNELDK